MKHVRNVFLLVVLLGAYLIIALPSRESRINELTHSLFTEEVSILDFWISPWPTNNSSIILGKFGSSQGAELNANIKIWDIEQHGASYDDLVIMLRDKEISDSTIEDYYDLLRYNDLYVWEDSGGGFLLKVELYADFQTGKFVMFTYGR